MFTTVGLSAGGRSGPFEAAGNLSADGRPSPVSLTRPGVAQAVYAALVELGAGPDELIAEVGLDPGLFDGGSKPVPYASLGRLIGACRKRSTAEKIFSEQSVTML